MIEWTAELLGVPENKGAVLAPLFVMFSAIMGSGVAIWAIFSNRKTARLKNSLDFIHVHTNNDDLWKSIGHIINLSKNNSEHKFQELATIPKNTKETDENTDLIHILEVLNQYEAMAICINNNIYDDTALKTAIFSTVKDVYKATKPFIVKRREITKIETLFQEFEVMSENWLKNPLKKKHNGS